MRVSAILKPNSLYVDTSPYVSEACKNTKYEVYGAECWIRIHITRAKLIAALTAGNSRLAPPRERFSTDPANYVLSEATLALEVYNVLGQPYSSNSLSVGYMLGDVYVFELN